MLCIVKNKNAIYVNTAKKIANYYLNTKEETYNRAHNMIPLFIIANENEIVYAYSASLQKNVKMEEKAPKKEKSTAEKAKAAREKVLNKSVKK